MEGEDGQIDTDYGLDESIQEPGGDGHDEYNDDTFGDDVPTGGDWAQDSNRLAQLHETFLAERQGGAGFFDLDGAGEDELGALESAGTGLGDGYPGDGELAMDASLRDMLDTSSPPRRAPAAPPGHINGLRVSGLPPTLSEEQARQLLSHFGPLSSFELRPGAAGSTVILSYQNPAVAESACASLQGIPLGGSVLNVQVVNMPTQPLLPPSAAAPLAFGPHGSLPARTAPALTPAAVAAPPPPGLEARMAAQCSCAAGAAPPLPSGPRPPQHAWPQPPVPWMAVPAVQVPGVAGPTVPVSAMAGPVVGSGAGRPPPPHMPPPPRGGMPVPAGIPQGRRPPPFPVGIPPGGPPPPGMPPVPPHVRQAMAQVAHLPPAQQHALLAQMMAQHQRAFAHMQQLHQSAAPVQDNPRPAPEEINLNNVRVSRRMTGQELQLIIRHQAMQVQMTDPVVDDFYHHFWMMKGGRSHPSRPTLNAPQVKTSTTRVPVSSEHITASLGAGTATARTPMAKIGAPKPLIMLPAAETDAAQPAAAGASVPGLPLSAPRWLLRRQVAAARDALIELRVHASSPAIRTPAGQERRLDLVNKLWLLIHDDPLRDEPEPPDAELEPEIGYGGSGVSPSLLSCAKGHKLLAELLPLFPEHMVTSVLRAAVRHVEAIAQLQAAHVPAFSAALAAAPKQLKIEQAAALLQRLAAAPALRTGLQRPEVQGLVLGLLCHPHMSTGAPGAAESFYEAAGALAGTSEKVWDLLDAILPAADAAHTELLRRLTGRLEGSELSDGCRGRLQAFGAALAAA